MAAGAVFFFIAMGITAFFIFKKPIAAPLSFPVPSLSPDLVFQRMDSSTTSLLSLHGQFLVLDIWASWCMLCVEHMSQLGALQKEFDDQLVMIEVNRGESFEMIKKYLEQHNGNSDLVFLLDTHDALYRAIEGFSMPETVFIDKEGKIVDHTRGPMGIIEMRRRIQDSFAL